MNRRFRAGAILFFVLFISVAATSRAQDTYCNPLDVLIADPFVLRFKDLYYLYGTADSRQGFETWSSPDLVHWQSLGFAYRPHPGDWAKTSFWASECFEHHGKFYLHGGATTDGIGNGHHRIILCEANSPAGPFHVKKAPWFDVGQSSIDSDVFRDTDGKLYLYYVKDASESPCSQIFVRRINDDLTVDNEAHFCARPEQHWEGTLINEGPFMLKHNSTYYLMYSGNGTPDKWYAVGYATSSSPLGPFKKFEHNPILRRTETVSGPGHHSVIPSPDGKELFIVYHTHEQPSHPDYNRQLAIDRLTFVDDPKGGAQRMKVVGPTDTPQPMPSGSPAIVRGKSDEFDESNLDRTRWTIFNERPDHWQLKDGELVIDTQPGEVKDKQADIHNLFLTEAPKGNFAVTTHIHFHPDQDTEEAFLCLWQNHNNFLRLAAIHDGGAPKFQLGDQQDANYTFDNFPNTIGDDFYIRIESRPGGGGNEIAFQVSPDGQHWKPITKPTHVDLVNARIGFGADSSHSRRDVPAHFDFLRFEP